MRTHFFAWVLVSATCVAQSTWIVDAGGNGQFTEIQPAVDVAAPGDRIEVHPGNYARFTVREGLRIVARDAGARVSSIRAEDVPASQVLTLDGLEVAGMGGVELRRCIGTVILRRLRIRAAAATALRRCSSTG